MDEIREVRWPNLPALSRSERTSPICGRGLRRWKKFVVNAFEVIVGLHVLLALALVVFSRCGRIVSNRFEGAIIDRTSATCLSARQRGSVPLDRYAVLREELTVAGSLLRLESAYSQLMRGGRDI